MKIVQRCIGYVFFRFSKVFLKSVLTFTGSSPSSEAKNPFALAALYSFPGDFDFDLFGQITGTDEPK